MTECAICDQGLLKRVDLTLEVSVFSDNHSIKTPSILKHCSECGYICSLITHDYEDFYSSNYDFLLEDEDEEPVLFNDESNVRKYSENLVQFFAPCLTSGEKRSFLDIGAGKGNFLKAMHERFLEFDYHAIEPSKSYQPLSKIPFLKSHSKSFFASNLFPKSLFDYVSMINVLEHVPNPCDFMLDVRKVMAEDAMVLVEVPNFENNLIDLLACDHVSKFFPDSFENLLRKTGFDVVARETNKVVPMQYVIRKSDFHAPLRCDSGRWIAEAVSYLRDAFRDAERLRNRKIAVYGQSIILTYLIECGIFNSSDIVCVIDDNVLYQGRKWRRLVDIVSYAHFMEMNTALPVFLAMNPCYHRQVAKKLEGHEVYGGVVT